MFIYFQLHWLKYIFRSYNKFFCVFFFGFRNQFTTIAYSQPIPTKTEDRLIAWNWIRDSYALLLEVANGKRTQWNSCSFIKWSKKRTSVLYMLISGLHMIAHTNECEEEFRKTGQDVKSKKILLTSSSLSSVDRDNFIYYT